MEKQRGKEKTYRSIQSKFNQIFCSYISVCNVIKCNILVFLQTGRAHLHSLSLVRSCVQKAVGLLRDTNGVASRSMQRMKILLSLLGPRQGHIEGKHNHVRKSLVQSVPRGSWMVIIHCCES